MFLHVGGDVTVSLKQVVAILDLRSTQNGESNRQLLESYRKRHRVDDISDGDPRSLVLTTDRIYLSPISSLTLLRRADFLRNHVLLDLENSTNPEP